MSEQNVKVESVIRGRREKRAPVPFINSYQTYSGLEVAIKTICGVKIVRKRCQVQFSSSVFLF